MKKDIRLGLRENAFQFSILVVVNAFVGAMIGLERTLLPEIAEKDFWYGGKDCDSVVYNSLWFMQGHYKLFCWKIFRSLWAKDCFDNRMDICDTRTIFVNASSKLELDNNC